MIFKYHYPEAPLSQFIENFFYYEGYNPSHKREKILPDGAIELLIDFEEKPKKLYEDAYSDLGKTLKRSWISGERTKYIYVGAEHTSMIVIRFRPGGVHPFCRFPVSELNNAVIETDLIWGDDIHHLRDELCETKSMDHRF
jgi:hypothetical protein